MNVLFVCSQNRLRSPTAEKVFESWPGISADSAGLDSTAIQPVTGELLRWAELIFLMETKHRDKLRKRFREYLQGQRLVVLGIPDDYEFMDAELVDLLKKRVPEFFPPHLREAKRWPGKTGLADK